MAKNLVDERKNSNIDSKQLVSLLYNGEENYNKFINYMKKFEENDLDFPRAFSEQSRENQIIDTLWKTPQILKKMDVDFGVRLPPDPYFNDGSRTVGGVGLGMCLPIINLSGTDEQKNAWMPKIQSGQIICAYAQTELAHGSDVQNLQTTAIYNEYDETFTVNTGSLDAYKWWPGDLGKNSNYAMVYARLYSKGEYRGLYPLFFQVRDMYTHKLLPGIEGGDIGPKLGYSNKENGYMAFNSIKVPRTALQSKFVEVHKNGDFEIKGNILIFYSAMMSIRLLIVGSSPKYMLFSVLSALRYSHFRSQFKPEKSKPERYIIEYQLQKAKIYPYLAMSYVFHFCGAKIHELVTHHFELVSKNEDFSLMKECHILLSLGKAQYSSYGNDCGFVMMQACGGHGFQDASGFARVIDRNFPAAIYEGVNTILFVQVGNELNKTFSQVTNNSSEDAKVLHQMSYFKEMEKLAYFKADSDRCRDILTYMDMFAKTVIYQVQKSHVMRKSFGTKMSKKDLQDMKSGNHMIEASVIHGYYVNLKFFNEKISVLSDCPLKKALSKLGLITAIFWMNQMASAIFSSGAADQTFFEIASQNYENLLDEIHPDALVLAEGYQFTESYIQHNSAIANSNGKIYENLMDYAKKYGAQNKFDVHPTMQEYISAQKEGNLMNPKL